MNLSNKNDIFNNFKENKLVQKFIKELSNDIEMNFKKQNKRIPIIEEILSKNNFTTGNKNAIIFSENDVILNYVEKNKKDDTIYFVKDSKKVYWAHNKEYFDEDYYTVLKIENKNIEKVEISKDTIPKNINVNDVFKIENGEYIIDTLATKELQEEIKKMAESILKKQNSNLQKYRIEDHLYMVAGELENSRILIDITENPKIEFEESDLPKDLLTKAVQGTVLKFSNGTYKYYSDDGFFM